MATMPYSGDLKNKHKTMTNKIHVTLLLNQWQAGDKQALDNIIPLVYQELRQLATAQLNRNKKNSIQCTELVAEAYIRLIDTDNINWNDRNHFYSMAARTMRRVLVDKFRKNNADKRGNNQTLLTFKDDSENAQQQTLELDKLEDALTELEKLDSRQAEIVTLRFFGGLKSQEIAEVLSVSTRTVRRDWSVAKLWLFREVNT